MADRSSIEDVIATGETTVESPIIISQQGKIPPGRHVSIAMAEGEDAKFDGAREEREGQAAISSDPNSSSGATTERHLSVASTGTSEAPTIITMASDYTANTGGRARYSSREGDVDHWPAASTLPARRPSVPRRPESKNNDGHQSTTGSVSDEDHDKGELLVELPAVPITGSGDPPSFFDIDSDESEGESIIRTASRASSAPSQPPRIVDHYPHSAALGQGRTPSRVTSAGTLGSTRRKAEQILGARLSNVLEQAPSAERNVEPASVAKHGEKNSPPAVTGSVDGDTRSQQSLSSHIIEATSTPVRAEALDTLPAAFAGFGALRLDKRRSGQLTLSPLDALRSNPVTSLDTAEMRRSPSAPVLCNAQKRKVKIRPADLESVRPGEEKKLFRDSIVSTPYPFRRHSIDLSSEKPTAGSGEKKMARSSSKKEKSVDFVSTSPRRSPPEILVLELALAKQRVATKIVTLTIYDRSTFDDCELFTFLRWEYYHSLLGLLRRYLSARTLSDVALVFSPASFSRSADPSYLLTATTANNSFDAASFLKHLENPKCGRKRKMWLQWLRRCQPRALAATLSAQLGNNAAAASIHGGHCASHPCFSPEGIPHSPAFVDPRPPPTPPTASAAPAASSDPSLSANASSSLEKPVPGYGSVTPHHVGSSNHTTMPKIVIHHSLSSIRLALAITVVTFFTLAATTLWVVLGYPGAAPHDSGQQSRLTAFGVVGDGSGTAVGQEGSDWKLAAQTRIMTGLVMGLLVFFLGAAQVVGWVIMSSARL